MVEAPQRRRTQMQPARQESGPEAAIAPTLEANARAPRRSTNALKPASFRLSVFGDDRICAVVAARSAADAIRQIKAAGRVKVVELRLDFLSHRAEIARLLGWL